MSKLPFVSIPGILRVRSLVSGALIPFLGKQIDLTDVITVAAKLSKKLDKTRKTDICQQGVVDQGLRKTLESEILGAVLGNDDITRVATRIAGNIERVQAGIPIYPFVGFASDEWAAVSVVDVLPYVTPAKKIGGALTSVVVLTGSASGKTFRQFLSTSNIFAIYRMIGLHKRRHRPQHIPRELVKIKLMVHFNSDGVIDRFEAKSGLNKYNKDLIEQRKPATRVCPKGLTIPCHMCQLGYNECKLGTHKDTYISRECEGDHTGYFPPNDARKKCLMCENYRWKRILYG